MTEDIGRILLRVARTQGTPCYVYFPDRMTARVDAVRGAFGGRFGVSYAVKANPNPHLLEHLRPVIDTLDVSSIGEVDLALDAGYEASNLTFSGPAKRVTELERAVGLGVGELVCESAWEIAELNRLAGEAGRRMPFFIRISPQHAPRHFGVHMAGRAGQFGIDEEDLDDVLDGLHAFQHLELRGFHIYSGSNALRAEAIAENFEIFIDLFTRSCARIDLCPAKLIFGAGFGIPYMGDAEPLDLGQLAQLVNPRIDEMKRHPLLADAQCVLEMGRYLVGPEGYLLTSVLNEKTSRGVEIRMCDAGFNAHLAAFGLLGTVIRRNWPIWKLDVAPHTATSEYTLTGPLCTTIDTLATKIQLPRLARGDVLAVGSSGAYSLTASPTAFISHPVPREYFAAGTDADAPIIDVTRPGSGTPARCSAAGGDL